MVSTTEPWSWKAKKAQLIADANARAARRPRVLIPRVPPRPTQPRPTPVARRQTTHFRFFDLPAGLRNAVYEELVVVGRDFYFKSDVRSDNDQYRKPSVKLFRACKQMHAEAEPLYLAKNIFHLPLN